MKTLTLISLLAFSVAAHAQQQIAEEQAQKILAQDNDSVALFKGAAVGVDLFGPARYKLGSYGNAEASLRINLRDTFFPIFELGYGMCDHTNDETNISYKSKAPYFRVGCDYNMLRNKHQGNRLYAGVRFGYTKFKYDVETHTPIVDPVWGGEELYFQESTWLRGTDHRRIPHGMVAALQTQVHGKIYQDSIAVVHSGLRKQPRLAVGTELQSDFRPASVNASA